MRITVTGASGFIAKHILLRLLDAGHSVTGTLRTPARAEEVCAALRPALKDPAALARLRFATLDLEADAGWAEALSGAEALLHTASPFPIVQPKDRQVLIRPAVEGTLRALRAADAAGVTRVVLTSSVAAIGNRELDPARPLLDEHSWTDIAHPAASPYAQSKTLAERAAWDFAEAHPGLALTTINPALVLGPPLDRHYGSSVGVISRVLSGKDPMVPRIGFSVVDVRDVAEMHLQALILPAATGKRFIAAAGFLWFKELAEAVAAVAPGRRIARRVAPDLLIRALALFDPAIRTILPNLGRPDRYSNARAREVLGIDFIPPVEAVQATTRVLLAET